MTRFRSSVPGFIASLVLAGCATSSGVAVPAIAPADVAAAYIPLHQRIHLGLDSNDGAAMTIAPGIAVTCGHNANLVEPGAVIGMARDYDLLFFRTGRRAGPATAPVMMGSVVTAYGQGTDGMLRLAHGVVRSIQTCPGCTAPAYFTFSNEKRGAGDAGPGFSGGPVLDESGRLIGITFGYRDRSGERLIYAYDMTRVEAERKAIAGTLR